MKKAGVAILLAMLAMPAFGQGVIPIRRASAVTIADCDGVTGLHAWWKADAGITQDVGVTTWADQKNSYNWTQLTDADEPTLTSSCQNSLDCVEFGATDYMSQSGAAEFFDYSNNDYTWIVVSNHMTDNDDDTYIQQAGTSTDRVWWSVSGGRAHLAAVGGSQRVITANLTANTTHIVAWRWDQSAPLFESFIDGNMTPHYSGADSANTVEDGTVYLGTNIAQTIFGDKKVMEVCVFLSDVSDSDLSGLFTMLNTKWAVY